MITNVISVSPDQNDLRAILKPAADIIKSGGLVVFPTETVYGLGADATNSEAALKIYQAKGRPSDNPLIIHIATPQDAEKYTYTNELYYKIAERYMPGPITVIMRSKDVVPSEIRAGLPTVAVRCPENVIAHTLIELSGVPIAAPSANLSGSPSPTKFQHVLDDMFSRVDMIIDGGDAEFGLESTIVKIEDDNSLTLLRPGKITVEELSELAPVKVAPAVLSALSEGEAVLSPGLKYRHYAPEAPLFLLDGDIPAIIEYIKSQPQKNVAVIAYKDDVDKLSSALPYASLFSFGKRDDEEGQAHVLFSILREADKLHFDKIYAPLPSASGVGLALYNRMIRAAAHQIIKL